MIYKAASGEFVTIRQCPKLVLIETSINDDNILSLAAPEMLNFRVDLSEFETPGFVKSVKMWRKHSIEGFDCGDEVSDWLCKFLSKPSGVYRLIYQPPEAETEGLLKSRSLIEEEGTGHRDTNAKALFPDGYSVSLLSEISLTDLNKRTFPDVFSVRHFRPNIFVSTFSDKTYPEDKWAKVCIGNSCRFETVEQCTRCTVPTVDPETSTKHPNNQPLRMLRSYRTTKEHGDAPLFGTGLSPIQGGRIRVGDPVYALEQALLF